MDEGAQYLSERGIYAYNYYEFLIAYLAKVLENEYERETNPTGVINLGTANNKVMEKEVEDHLNQSDGFKFVSKKHQYYYSFGGVSAVKNSLVRFYQKFFGASDDLKEKELIVVNGSAAGLDALSHALFDPEDIYITPTPAYARIFTNFNNRSLAKPVALELPNQMDDEDNSFTLSGQLLENKILQLLEDGKKPKGFVLINPQNPLGDVLSKDVVEDILNICHKYELHVIVDEVYIQSVIDPEVEPVSVLSLKNIPDPMRTHVVWGLSKDFGLAGLRFGVVYTKNPAIQKVLNDFVVYGSPASIVQHAVANFLNDHKWLEESYFPLLRTRLQKQYNIAKTRLETMDIKIRPCKAGLYIWFSLKAYLDEQTFEKEMDLFEEFMDAGVYIVPGSQLYCKTPGWFRLIISSYENDLNTGLTRIQEVLKNKK